MVEKCLRKICWDKESDLSLIGKLERLFHRLKRDGGDVYFFWQQICENNAYAAVCLLKVLSAQYGEADAALQAGKRQVQEYLTILTRHNASTVLALLISGDFEAVKRIYEQNLVEMEAAGEIVKRLDGMCTEQQLGTILCSWLWAGLYGPVTCQLSIYKAIVLKFRLHGKNFQYNPALESYCRIVSESGDLAKMIGIMTVFDGIYLPEVTGKSLEEFRRIALDGPSPTGSYMYEMILAQSDLPDTEQEKLLKTFTVQFGFRSTEHIWSDFLLFSHLVKKDPDKLPDYLKKFSYLSQYSHWACPNINRRAHYDLVEEPFRKLVSARSLYLTEYLRLVKPCSKFAYLENKPYMKNKTWHEDGAGQSLNLYLRFIEPMLEEYGVAEAVEIYMNSPLKSYVDFYYFSCRLWKKIQEEGGEVNQVPALFSDYWFRGHLERSQKESFKVSVSSVSSTYKFPVLYKWGVKNEEMLEKLYQSKRPVFFKIYGINPKTNMVFAYQIQEEVVKPQVWTIREKPEDLREDYNELIQRAEESLEGLKKLGRAGAPIMMANQVKNQVGQLEQILSGILRNVDLLLENKGEEPMLPVSTACNGTK